jgi:hypothetical protein
MGRSRYTLRVKLGQRDLQFFEMIGKRGCVTLETIHRNFWQGAKLDTCKARVEQLKRAGYLQSEIVDVRGRQEIIYYLDRKARSQFDEQIRKTFYKRRPPMNEIRHALNMGDILDTFSSKVVNFTNEHQLKSQNSYRAVPEEEVADGFVSLEDGGGSRQSFYIECDGAYYGQRLTTKLAQMAASGKPILWVSWSTQRVQHIAHLARTYQNIVPIHFNDVSRI